MSRCCPERKRCREYPVPRTCPLIRAVVLTNLATPAGTTSILQKLLSNGASVPYTFSKNDVLLAFQLVPLSTTPAPVGTTITLEIVRMQIQMGVCHENSRRIQDSRHEKLEFLGMRVEH